MIGRIAFLTAMVAAPSTFAVGYWQAQNHEPETQLSRAQVNAPVLARPGSGAAGAARYFAGLNAPPPPPPPPIPTVVVAAPAGPPPIDVSVLFRREVTAVLTQGQPHVVLAGGRQIAQGEVYRDGWRVSDLTAQNVVLAKGSETRNINLFSAPPPQENIQFASAAPIFTSAVGLTNGMTPQQRMQQILQNPNMTQQQRSQAMQQLMRTLGPDALALAMQAGQGANARGGQGGQGGQGGGRGGQGAQAGGGQGGGRGGQAATATGGFTGGFNGGFGGGGGGGGRGGGGGGR